MTAAITDAEKLREHEQRIRDALTELARWIVDPARTKFPHAVVVALCPTDVDPVIRDDAFADLLRIAEQQGPDHTDLPWEGQVDLNEMTRV